MNRLDIFQRIAIGVADATLVFPTSVRVTLRLHEALQNPECHIEVAEHLIRAEPLLAARVMAMANSVVYNPYGREVSDLRTAVARLGFPSLRSLCMALLTRQMAGANLSLTFQAMADALWEHTTHVAALSRVLARRVTKVDPEVALFAGIVHEVAGFYLLSQAENFPGLVDDDCADWIESGERLVGAAVLDALQVPGDVRSAVEAYWGGYLAMPPISLGDTLLLAEELSPVSSPLHRLPGAMRGEGLTPEIDMLIGEVMLTEIMEESAAEVASLIAALRF